MARANDPRSGCPIGRTLDIVGDRWSLLIIRDLVNGKSRFNEFLTSPEAITTNVLTDRLTSLEQAGILSREPYQLRPKRFAYRLTSMGWDLLPVLQDICRWANRHIEGTWIPPEQFMRRRPGNAREGPDAPAT